MGYSRTHIIHIHTTPCLGTGLFNKMSSESDIVPVHTECKSKIVIFLR